MLLLPKLIKERIKYFLFMTMTFLIGFGTLRKHYEYKDWSNPRARTDKITYFFF